MKLNKLFLMLACAVAGNAAAVSVIVKENGVADKNFTLIQMTAQSSGDIVLQVEGSGGNQTNYHALTASSTPANGGKLMISVNGGVSYQFASPANIQENANVKIEAVPGAGFIFDKWQSPPVVCDGAVCNFTMNSAKQLSAVFKSTGGGNNDDCPPSSGNLKVTCTEFPQTIFGIRNIKPEPSDITVYRIGPFSAQGRYGSVSTTSSTQNRYGQMVILSETPGETSWQNSKYACWAYGNEVASVSFQVNKNASEYSYCKLEPGKYYFVNVISKSTSSQPGEYLCSNKSNCSYKLKIR